MAFKMNREGFTFYTKPKSPKTHNHGLPKYGHDKGPTKYDDTHMTRYKSHATLQGDLDKDGKLSDYEANRQSKIDESRNKSKDGPTKNKYSHNTMRTPYEKNKYSSSHMSKHGGDHPISDADKKRKEVLIEKLNKMSDPMDSNQGKATLKAIKKIDPNFDAETYM